MDRKLNKISIIISYLSIFISIIGTFFVTPVILKNIGDSNFGLYSFCTSITSWFAILTTAVGSSYIYFANKDIKENNDCSRTNTMFIRMFVLVPSIVFSLLVLLVPLLYFSNITLLNYSLEDSKAIFLLFGISGVQVVVSILFNFFHLFLISKEKFFFVRLKNLLVEVGLYLLLLLSALVFKSIFAVAISSLVTTTISGVLNIAMVIKLKNLSFYKPQKGEFKGKYNEILTYIFFVLINTLITTMNNNLDKTLLGAMVGPLFVTLYQLSFSFSLYLTLMSGFISETYMPRIHGFYKDGLNEEAEKYQTSLKSKTVESNTQKTETKKINPPAAVPVVDEETAKKLNEEAIKFNEGKTNSQSEKQNQSTNSEKIASVTTDKTLKPS